MNRLRAKSPTFAKLLLLWLVLTGQFVCTIHAQDIPGSQVAESHEAMPCCHGDDEQKLFNDCCDTDASLCCGDGKEVASEPSQPVDSQLELSPPCSFEQFVAKAPDPERIGQEPVYQQRAGPPVYLLTQRFRD